MSVPRHRCGELLSPALSPSDAERESSQDRHDAFLRAEILRMHEEADRLKHWLFVWGLLSGVAWVLLGIALAMLGHYARGSF